MADSAFSADPDALLRELGWVRALARTLVRDRDTAEDIAQDTLLAAWSTRTKPRGALRPWLARILRRRKVDRHRSDERRRRREQRAAARELAPETGDVLERAELQRRLVNAIFALDDPYRRTILLRYFEGLDAEEVARRERISPTTVRTRTKRALDRLRTRLDEEFESRRQWQLALLPLVALPGAPFPPPASAASATTTTVTVGGLALVNSKSLAALLAGILLLLFAGYVVYDKWQSNGELPRVAVLPIPPADEPSEAPPEPEPRPASPALPPPVDLEAADRDLDLFGIVVDADVKPIAGATVATVRRPWCRADLLRIGASGVEEVGPTTRTAVDGTFSVRLERGDRVDLRFTHPGYARTELSWCQAGEFVEAVLQPAGELEVTVVDDAAHPVADAEITFYRYDRTSRDGGDYDWRRQVTDAEGRTIFLDMAPVDRLNFGNLRVEHPYAGGSTYVWPAVVVEAGKRTSIVVNLEAGRTLRGRVVDAETGEPIAGARVGADWILDRAVTTDESGRYTFLHWTGANGAELLYVTAEGYGRAKAHVPPVGEIDFALERGYRVRGRVVDPRGHPVPGAIVSTVGGFADHLEGTTDRGGVFVFDSMRKGITQTLIVLARGYGRYLLDFDDGFARDGVVDLGDVVVPDGQRIEGVVLGADDEPLAGVSVTLIGANADRGHLWETPREPPSAPHGAEESRRTDDLGRFRFRDLSPGDYVVALRKRDVPEIDRGVTLPPGEDVQDIVLKLAAGRSLTVVLRDEDGAPLAGLNVQIGPVVVPTDDDGRAAAGGLPDEPVPVFLSVGVEYLQPPRDDYRVTPAGQEITFVLRRAALLSGVVLRPDGVVLGHHDVIVYSSATGEYVASTFCNAEGEFTLGVEPGSVVDLCVQGERVRDAGEPRPDQSYTGYRGRLSGVVAPASDLELQTHLLPCDRSLTILLRDPADAPVAAMSVMIDRIFRPGGADGPPDIRSFGQFTADLLGRIRIENLTPEELRIEVAEVPVPDLELPEPVTVVPDGQEIILRYRSHEEARPRETPKHGASRD